MSSPAWLHALIDDAAIFPPGNAPLDRAVAEHREHRSSAYADLVGGFVISDVKVPDLLDVLDVLDDPEEVLDINLVVTGGAGAIGPAVTWAVRAPTVRVRAVEFALRDEEDLAHNAQRVLTALDQVLDRLGDAEIYVEPPRLRGEPSHGWLSALDVLAARDVRLKFRTGGADQDFFPTCGELGDAITSALDRELAFKCTAGLHHAVRQVDPETGLTQHGFLNVLRATRAGLEGEDPSDILAEESATALLDGFDTEIAAATRRWFTGFGSCSVLEPHDDLVDLGLL